MSITINISFSGEELRQVILSNDNSKARDIIHSLCSHLNISDIIKLVEAIAVYKQTLEDLNDNSYIKECINVKRDHIEILNKDITAILKKIEIKQLNLER